MHADGIFKTRKETTSESPKITGACEQHVLNITAANVRVAVKIDTSF